MSAFIQRELRPLRNTVVFIALALLARFIALRLEAHGAAGAAPIVEGAAVLAVGLGLIRLAGIVFFRGILPAANVRPPRIAEDITILAAYAAWCVVRLRLAGMDLASLVTTSAVITAVIAFAMQDTLGNVLGGLFLELDRSIAIGDWVRLDDLSGRVEEIRWRHTAIRTRNGERVIVPNSTLMKSRFFVIGDPDKEDLAWRRWIWFNVRADVSPAKVIAATEGALAGEIPNVRREPKPSCVVMDFAGAECRYALRYWLRDPRPDDPTDSAVRTHLLAALHRAGITPSAPEYVVHEVKENEKREQARHVRELEERAAALRAVDLFAPLADAEVRALAEHLVPAPFAAGDVVTRQGAVAHWLYLLMSGTAEVWLEAADGARRKVAELGPGNVFGEMGMMTGEPRRATVVAQGDVECYRLDKAGFETVLRSRPEIAEQMSHVLALRASGLRHVADEADAEAAAAAKHRSENVLARIRSFFHLEHAGTMSARTP